MEQNKNNFQTVAGNAEEKLTAAANGIDTAMSQFDEEKIKNELEKLTDKKTEEIISLMLANKEKAGNVDACRKFKPSVSSLLEEFPSLLGEKLLKKLLAREEWNTFSRGRPDTASINFSTMLSTLGGNYRRENSESDSSLSDIYKKIRSLVFSKDKSTDTLENKEPLTFSFDKNDFPHPPAFLGAELPENIALSYWGDTAHNIGQKLNGGKIFINGNTKHALGYEMKKGEIVIFGNTDSSTGDAMVSGEITVHGDAKDWTGCNMEGGEITILKNCGESTGVRMLSGKITIGGNAGSKTGAKMSGGTIVVKGDTGNMAASEMNGGTIKVEGGAGSYIGLAMHRGTIDIAGKVISFAQSAFLEDNHGIIIWNGVTLWNNGWTKEGEKMRIAGKIPEIHPK